MTKSELKAQALLETAQWFIEQYDFEVQNARTEIERVAIMSRKGVWDVVVKALGGDK